MKKMIGIPMRLCAGRDGRARWDHKKCLAPFRKLPPPDLPRNVAHCCANFCRLLRGADWRAQLDQAWEDCKSRNLLAAEQQWSGRASERPGAIVESAPDSRDSSLIVRN